MSEEINVPEQKSLSLAFNPKFKLYEKVDVWTAKMKRKNDGVIMDCVGIWMFPVNPLGQIIADPLSPTASNPPNVTYAVTFDGNVNNVEWYEEDKLIKRQDNEIN